MKTPPDGAITARELAPRIDAVCCMPPGWCDPEGLASVAVQYRLGRNRGVIPSPTGLCVVHAMRWNALPWAQPELVFFTPEEAEQWTQTYQGIAAKQVADALRGMR